MPTELFPIHLLPKPVQHYIDEIHQISGFSKNMLAMNGLFALASAIGRSYTIRFKNHYEQLPILYGCIVSKSGSGKSPVMNYMFDEHHRIFRHFELRRKEDLLMMKQSEAAFEPPARKITTFSDATPSAIAKYNAGTPKGIICTSDELAGWFKNLNAFSNKNDKEWFLSAWNGKAVMTLRSTVDTFYFNPCCSILGGIQNDLVRILCQKADQDSGLNARFLFCTPETDEVPQETEYEVSDPTVWAYRNLIRAIYGTGLINPDDIHSAYDDENGPTKIECTQETRDYLREYRNDLRRQTVGSSESVTAAYNKMTDYVLRFALILEVSNAVAEGKTPVCVKRERAEEAVELANFFLLQHHAIDDRLNLYDPVDELTDEKQRFFNIMNQSGEVFTLHDAKVAAKSINFKSSHKTLQRFLNDRRFFKRVRHGVYATV